MPKWSFGPVGLTARSRSATRVSVNWCAASFNDVGCYDAGLPPLRTRYRASKFRRRECLRDSAPSRLCPAGCRTRSERTIRMGFREPAAVDHIHLDFFLHLRGPEMLPFFA